MIERASHRILLVDDESDVRASLQMLLERHGHAVTTAANCQEAVERVHHDEEHPFRVAIVDLRLPDGSGVDVVKTVKQCSPKTICLLITAYPSDDLRQTTHEAGAEHFFVKPFSVEQLLAFIAKGVLDG